MALIFTDGFDDYSVETDIANKWDTVDESNINYLPTSGRFGGGCVAIIDDDIGLAKYIPTTGVTGTSLFITASILINDSHDPGSEPLMWLNSPDGVLQASLYLAGGIIDVRRSSSSGSVVGITSTPLLADTWYTLEIEIVCENSGSCIVRIDGVEVINATGDLRASGYTSGVSWIEFTGKDQPTNTGIYWDDIVIYDSSGSSFNSFIGPTRIASIKPNAIGDDSDGIPTVGNNYENVDDIGSHDGDTTGVSFSTTGDKDLYHCESLPVTPIDIKGVVVSAYSRADGTTPREAKLKIKHGGTEADGEDFQVPHSVGYAIRQDGFAVNPSTGLAWTEAEINAMQIGLEVVT